MKNVIVLLVVFLFSVNTFGSSPLEKAVDEFNKANDVNGFFESLNNFERLIAMDSDNWISYYYAAFSLINIAMQSEVEKIDEYCDKADYYLQKADNVNPDNSEIFCLKALSATTRISVAPASRGFQYVSKSNSHLGKAEALDNSNPRVHYLKGMNTLNSPPVMGGGAKAAMPHFAKAVELYKTADATKDKLLPAWGHGNSKAILERIREQE